MSRAPHATATLGHAYDPRHNNFAFLRFALATTVFWSHAYSLADRPEPLFVLSGQATAGLLAVESFFILSGFLVTQSWLSRPVPGIYARKRALRLLPGLLVAVAFSAFVVGPLVTTRSLPQYLTWPRPWLLVVGVVFHSYLRIPGLFPHNPFTGHVNGSLWSLRYEMLCYGIVGLVGVLGARRWRPALGVLFLLAWGLDLAALAQRGLFGTWWFWTPHLLACFAAGMVFYEFRDRVPHHPALALAAVALLAGTTAFGGLRACLPLAGGYALLFLACWPRLRLQRFGNRGDFSYGLYVYAYPVQQLTLHLAGGDLRPLPFCALAFPPTLLLAVLSWRWVEAPALAHKPR